MTFHTDMEEHPLLATVRPASELSIWSSDNPAKTWTQREAPDLLS